MLSTITRIPQFRSWEFPTLGDREPPLNRGNSDWVSGCWFGELVHVGLSGLLRAPAGGAQRVDELLGVLADLDGELAALLAGVLVGAERAMDLPVDVLQCVGRSSWVELRVGVREAIVGVVELLDDFDVALELRGQPRGELAGVRGHGTVIGGGAHGVVCGLEATGLRSCLRRARWPRMR